MTFAVEKEKQASERFMLVRLNFKVDETDDSYLDGLWKIVAKSKPIQLFIVSQNLTPPATTYEEEKTEGVDWFFDAATGIISYPRGAFFYRVNVVYQEYLTGVTERYFNPDPLGGGSPVTWQPLLGSYPEINQSIEDFSTGNLSISSSELSIINSENWLGKYLVGNATILEQGAKIWLGINDQIQLVFNGSMASATTQGLGASIRLLDSLQKLNKQALFGVSIEKSTISKEFNLFLSLYPTPGDVGSAIPRHFARRTIHGFDKVLGTITSPNDFFTGYCLTFSEPGPSTNRSWVCGRIKDTGRNITSNITLANQGFGSISGTVALDTFVRAFNAPSPSNLVYGQTVTWSTSGTQRGIIAEVGAFTYLGNPYNLKVFCLNSNVGTTGNIFTTQPAIALYIKRGNDTVNLVYGRDYTASTDSNGTVLVALVSDFEANFPSIFTTAAGRYLNPETDKLAYYYLTEGSLNHSRILKTMLEAAGITVNAASFTAAESALSADVCFSIPTMGSGQIGPYADYVSAILESAGGYLTMNNSGEIEYKLYADPAPTVSIDDSEHSGLSIDFEYQDFYSKIQATNDHFRDDKLLNSQSLGSEKSEYATNERAFFLSGQLTRTRNINHVFETLANSMSRILRVSANRKAVAQLSSATKFIDYKLGDDITIVSDKLPGGVASADFKIVSKTIDGEKTTIRAVDFFDY